MNNLNNTIVFISIFIATGFLALLTSYLPVTTNAQKVIENREDNVEKFSNGIINTIPKSCKDSFLSKNEGGSLSQNVLSDLNMYLSQNPVAIGDEPLTNVKNVDGLCVLINLVDSESTQGRVANEEQIRNILNAALQEKSNIPAIEGIIDTLLSLNLIQPSDD
ncbi:MAG TPA: hypothetical protein VJU85_00410 [Nitrososphaeraceae archaeon]|nr:hypothetical protein [Nitrososphaeraceae archaeon]